RNRQAARAQRGGRHMARCVRQGRVASRVRRRDRRARQGVNPLVGKWLANTDPALRRAWHPVARSNEVTDTPHSVRPPGEDWVLVRLPELAAFVDRCPHRLAPLSAGSVDGGSLRCGYHGWCFGADGGCREIPSLGQNEHMPPRARATTPARI